MLVGDPAVKRGNSLRCFLDFHVYTSQRSGKLSDARAKRRQFHQNTSQFCLGFPFVRAYTQRLATQDNPIAAAVTDLSNLRCIAKQCLCKFNIGRSRATRNSGRTRLSNRLRFEISAALPLPALSWRCAVNVFSVAGISHQNYSIGSSYRDHHCWHNRSTRMPAHCLCSRKTEIINIKYVMQVWTMNTV